MPPAPVCTVTGPQHRPPQVGEHVQVNVRPRSIMYLCRCTLTLLQCSTPPQLCWWAGKKGLVACVCVYLIIYIYIFKLYTQVLWWFYADCSSCPYPLQSLAVGSRGLIGGHYNNVIKCDEHGGDSLPIRDTRISQDIPTRDHSE